MSDLASTIDFSLLYTIGLIFFVTLVGSYLRSRRKDPCLQSFEGYHVTLEKETGKSVWGVMELEATGMELLYRSDVQDDRHLESSYILYAEEYGEIQAIFRYADDLSPESSKRRQRDIERSFHPGPWERGKRALRMFVGTASDSINEVIGLLVGRAKRPGGRYITDKGEAYLNKLGTNLIGHVGGVYDPLLERYVGQKVVIELLEDGEVHEHVGIFKNYSPDFMEILDVQFPHRESVPLGPTGCAGEGYIRVRVDGEGLMVCNDGELPVLLTMLDVDGEQQELNAVVDAGAEVSLFVGARFSAAELHIRVVRALDMVVPRTRCLVRHRAERFQMEILPDVIFDVGTLLRPDRRRERWEKEYRDELKRNPLAASAAANLGGLLLQRGEYAEARRWLTHALAMRYSLPDNGRRAAMQLRELRHREGVVNAVGTPGSKPEARPASAVSAGAEEGRDESASVVMTVEGGEGQVTRKVGMA